jgi:hypothetical protein
MNHEDDYRLYVNPLALPFQNPEPSGLFGKAGKGKFSGW